MNPDIIIVGAGAAGLMAAATAGELGLRAVVLERKHQPGRKILMCGNNRCNLSSNLAVPDMLAAYGSPVDEFLRPAIERFSPAMLRGWFAAHGLPTVVHKDQRVFPKSLKADDVLHCFTDCLRDHSVPLVLNGAVETLSRDAEAFTVATRAFALRSPHVLLATGGVSYPKTGSVGDGQKFAKTLGHRLEPYRPGLVGFEVAEPWLRQTDDDAFPGVVLTVLEGGQPVARTAGEIACMRWGLRGPAIVDASRIVARRNLKNVSFEIDLCPDLTVPALAQKLAAQFAQAGGRRTLGEALGEWALPRGLAHEFSRHVLGLDPNLAAVRQGADLPHRIASGLKAWRLHPAGMRTLKEAMVTVGGVALADVAPETMQSRRTPGLFFAGEVLDVDGPTGGFNLHAAFATARLAVHTLAARLRQG